MILVVLSSTIKRVRYVSLKQSIAASLGLALAINASSVFIKVDDTSNSSPISFSGEKANGAVLTLTALCAVGCKLIGGAVIVVAGKAIETVVYKATKGGLYYIKNPTSSKKNQYVQAIYYVNYGSIKAGSLLEAVEECKKLARERGVQYRMVVDRNKAGRSDGRYDCMGAWE
jgi:hypothetical protein